MAALLVGIAEAEAGENLLKQSGMKGGVVVCVGADTSKGAGQAIINELAAAAAHGSFVIHCIDQDSATVEQVRRYIRSKSLYGKISADTYDGKVLPYVSSLVNLLIVADPSTGLKAEIERVLAPRGVAAIAKAGNRELLSTMTLKGMGSDGGFRMFTKPVPTDIDDWTHYLYDATNNAVSNDRQAGPPRSMQWMSDPLWLRSHGSLASISSAVSCGGRLFYVADRGPASAPQADPQWFLEARDGFNGVLLWQIPLRSWVDHSWSFRSGPVQIARLLVASEPALYAVLGLNEPITAIDPATGKVMRTYAGTEKVEEIILHEGMLLTVIGNTTAEHSLIRGKGRRKKGSPLPSFEEKVIKAIDTKTGNLQWQWPKEGFQTITPQTLGAFGNRVALQAGSNTVCIDLATGAQLWTSGGDNPKKKSKNGKPKKPKEPRRIGIARETLVMQAGVILSSGNGFKAFDMETGKVLWTGRVGTPYPTCFKDIMVINGLVWTSTGFTEGRELKTGKTLKELDLTKTLITKGHHHRCYRNKAVGDLVLYGFRGIEVFDTKGDRHSRNNWVRGTCQYGVLPANGLVYAPPNNCACYPEAMLKGLWALADERKRPGLPLSDPGRVRKGPAYGTVPAPGAAGQPALAPNDGTAWRTYRHDAARSGSTPAVLPTKLGNLWKADIGGDLTAPVAADGTVLLASRNTHTVYALDAEHGRARWSFTAGGPVNSPPTMYGKTVLFGSSDGVVYCLTLAEGKEIWRFDAAPSPRRTVVLEELESVWPVHGSILVKNDTAYFAAGRSTYLDGGLFLYGLDPRSGAVKHHAQLKAEHPGRLERPEGMRDEGKLDQNYIDYKTELGPDKSDAFSMEGNISDIMVADASSVYLRHMRFDDQLQRQERRAHHLFSTHHLLDDQGSHRSHWFFGNGDFSRIGTAYGWMMGSSYGVPQIPFGLLMVFDKETAWSVASHRGKVDLVAFDIRGIDDRVQRDLLKTPDRSKTALAEREKYVHWQHHIGVYPRSLVRAGDAFYIGGVKKVEELIGGKAPGLLQVFNAKGEMVLDPPLASYPVWDGAAAVQGKLFISCVDGSLVCLGKKK
jgi:outer membrane protein assembly factor BamB